MLFSIRALYFPVLVFLFNCTDAHGCNVWLTLLPNNVIYSLLGKVHDTWLVFMYTLGMKHTPSHHKSLQPAMVHVFLQVDFSLCNILIERLGVLGWGLGFRIYTTVLTTPTPTIFFFQYHVVDSEHTWYSWWGETGSQAGVSHRRLLSTS